MSRDFPNNAANRFEIGDVAAIDITGAALTIVAWIRPDTIPGEVKLVSKWGSGGSNQQYSLGLDTTDKVRCLVSSGTATTLNGATTVATGIWSHVGLRVKGTGASDAQVFLNGISDGSGTGRSIQNTSSLLKLGCGSDNTAPLDGLMGPVAIWNIALSDAEMLALAKGVIPLTIRRNNLRGYWSLWGTGSPERDYSGMGSHATMVGTVPAGTIGPPIMPSIPLGQESRQMGAVEDQATVLLTLSPLGEDLGPYSDIDTVYLDLQASGIEVRDIADAATVRIKGTPSSVDIHEKVDSSTVYLDLQASGVEYAGPEISWWDPLPEGVRDWWEQGNNNWLPIAQNRFTWNVRGRL